jgi:hypothetical protein
MEPPPTWNTPMMLSGRTSSQEEELERRARKLAEERYKEEMALEVANAIKLVIVPLSSLSSGQHSHLVSFVKLQMLSAIVCL